MAKFTNLTTGPKGVYALTGLVYVSAGATSDDLDVSEGELKSAKSTGWFDIDGAPVEDDERVDLAFSNLTIAELKKIAKAENVDLGDAKEPKDIVAAIELARESKAGA